MKLLINLPENWHIWKSIQEEISVLGIHQVKVVFDKNQMDNLLEISNPEIISGETHYELVTIRFRDEDILRPEDCDLIFDGKENGLFHEFKEEGKKFSFQILPIWVKEIHLQKSHPALANIV